MEDKKNKEFVCRVGGCSIYWSNRYAKKDASRFIIIKNGRQYHDTEDLYNAIITCLPKKDWTLMHRKRFTSLAKEFDPFIVNEFKKK